MSCQLERLHYSRPQNQTSVYIVRLQNHWWFAAFTQHVFYQFVTCSLNRHNISARSTRKSHTVWSNIRPPVQLCHLAFCLSMFCSIRPYHAVSVWSGSPVTSPIVGISGQSDILLCKVRAWTNANRCDLVTGRKFYLLPDVKPILEIHRISNHFCPFEYSVMFFFRFSLIDFTSKGCCSG